MSIYGNRDLNTKKALNSLNGQSLPIHQICPLFLMIQENVGMMPVVLDKKVVGMVRMNELFKEISTVVLGD